MKKFLAIILALACILSLCACGGNPTSNNGDQSGDQSGDNVTADGKVKLTIGLPTNAMVLSHDNNALTRWVEEQCNVELTFVEYSGGTDVPTQIATAIAGRRELPDILYGIGLNDSVITRYGKDGYFLDLSDYYADQDGASKIFWDRLNNELTEKEVDHILRVITDPETDAMYSVPTIETSLIDKMRYQMWINTEWLKNVGMEKPTNNKEMVEVLRAFKEKDPNKNGMADEIPLFGSQIAGSSAKVIDFVINTFTYYDSARKWSVDDNGKVSPVFTSDKYREALAFVNELYDEKLLSNVVWTCDNNNMKQIITPSNGTAMVGMFCGHLTLHASLGNDIIYQYEPVQTWGCAVRGDITCVQKTFITDSCKNPDKAFEVLMTLFSWEGSMRVRYGEYGVNWTDPDPGAKSDLGLDATYKMLSDPLTQQNTAKWSAIASCLNVYAEGETSQVDANTDPWIAKRSAMHAESYKLFAEAEAKNNPKNVCPIIVTTEDEQKQTESVRTNINSYVSNMMNDFCTGKADINDDKVWQKYLDELNKMGLDVYIAYVQRAYDRG